MKIKHINQMILADRWSISPRTLERWRWMGIGPQFLKIGGRVAYRLADIEQYEASVLHASTSAVSVLTQSPTLHKEC